TVQTRGAKVRAERHSLPVYLSPSRIAPQGCMVQVKGRVVAAWASPLRSVCVCWGEEVST
ncbi:MAG: hypothetical protein ACJ8CB_15760, partial [Ktedonobacteraceae bacterium]